MPTDVTQGFPEVVGLTFTDVESGYSRGTLAVTDELTNPNEVLHGAVLYTMADTGMAAALQPGLDEDERCATIELKINYLRPVRDGTVTCESELHHRGRSTAYLESTLRSDGETVARATGTFSIVAP